MRSGQALLELAWLILSPSSVAMVRQIFNVVHQAVQIPQGVHLTQKPSPLRAMIACDEYLMERGEEARLRSRLK